MIARLFEALLGWAFDLIRALIGGFVRAPLTAAELAARPVELRRGRPDEVVDVRHAVLRQGRPRETAIFEGDLAPATRHWVADRDGVVIGVVTVIASPMPEPPGGVAPALQLRGMAVLPEYRATGLGGALLEAVHVDVTEPMWCNARSAVVGFYAKHGWTAVGAEFDIPGVGPHRRMWWAPPAR